MSHLSPGSGRGLPGIYFHYEVSPIHAIFEEKRGGEALIEVRMHLTCLFGLCGQQHNRDVALHSEHLRYTGWYVLSNEDSRCARGSAD